MPKCSITQSGNDYAIFTPYDTKKSKDFSYMLKRYLLPEHRTPSEENGKFCWIIHASMIQSAALYVEEIFGEKPEIPELKPVKNP